MALKLCQGDNKQTVDSTNRFANGLFESKWLWMQMWSQPRKEEDVAGSSICLTRT